MTNPKSTSIFASKTLWFNVLSALVTIIQGQESLIDPKLYSQWALPTILFINFILRFVTSTPLDTPKLTK